MVQAEAVVADIERFRRRHGCARLVVVWCGSAEKHIELSDVHAKLDGFIQGLRDNHPAIAPSMIYSASRSARPR